MAVTPNVSGVDSTLLSEWYKVMQNNDSIIAQQANANETAIQNEVTNRQAAISGEVTARNNAITAAINEYDEDTVAPLDARVTDAEDEIGNVSLLPAIGATNAAIKPLNLSAAVTNLWNVLKTVTGRAVFYFDPAEFIDTTTASGVAYGEGATHKLHQNGVYIVVPTGASTIKSITFGGINASGTTITRTYTGDMVSGYVYLIDVGDAACTLLASIDLSVSEDIGEIWQEIAIINEDRVYQGTCATAAATAAKTVTVSGFPSTLSDGLTVRVRFTNGITGGANATLNVNSTGAKTINVCSSVDGLSFFPGISEGAEVVLTYNSTADVWVVVGSGLAWYADVAGELYEGGAQANILLPSFYNWAASVTTETFTTITEDIDSTYGTMASIDFSNAAITPNTGYRRMISLSFVSGATATAFTVPSAWYFVGDDCEDGDFVPAANTRYDVIIEYRNGAVRGYVSGYEVAV